jgi:thiamine transporter
MGYIAGVFEKFGEFKPITIVILVIIVLFVIFSSLKKKSGANNVLNTKVIVYGGLCIALSFVLSYIRLYHWPQGGSVTPASMLPMFVYAAIFGPVAGMVAGVAYGFLQLIQDPYVVHWAQLLLDYPLAFGAMGLAGLARNNLALASFIGGFGRFFMHFLSGVIFFGMYAPEGMSPIIYSLMVNGIITGTDTLICIVVSLVPGIHRVLDRVKNTTSVITKV